MLNKLRLTSDLVFSPEFLKLSKEMREELFWEIWKEEAYRKGLTKESILSLLQDSWEDTASIDTMKIEQIIEKMELVKEEIKSHNYNYFDKKEMFDTLFQNADNSLKNIIH